MRTCVVVVIEEVLVTDGVNAPLFDQHLLYRALGNDFRIIVLSCALDYEKARKFLRLHDLKFDVLFTKGDSILDDAGWKVAQVREVKASGWPVGYYLDNDPEAVRRVLAEGTPALLLAYRALRPLWLPENRETRAWAEVEAFIDAERSARRSPPQPG